MESDWSEIEDFPARDIAMGSSVSCRGICLGAGELLFDTITVLRLSKWVVCSAGLHVTRALLGERQDLLAGSYWGGEVYVVMAPSAHIFTVALYQVAMQTYMFALGALPSVLLFKTARHYGNFHCAVWAALKPSFDEITA